MSTYTAFIHQNTAPVGAVHIGVYDSDGNRIGGAGLQNLALPTTQRKQYGFLCVSDSHVGGSTEDEDGTADFIRALQYAENDPDIDFATICGDVIDSGTDYQFDRFVTLRDKYTTKPVYAITGNHEAYNASGQSIVTSEQVQEHYGHSLFWSVSHGNDVLIFLCQHSWTASTIFADGELQFLYNTLEANRNKRCFVFFHVPNFAEGDSGRPNNDFYADGDIFALSDANQTQKECFISLLQHYKNVVWFHGHTHALFQLQELCNTNDYSDVYGYRSVHIPSLAKPKDWDGSSTVTVEAESQGYVVDVYPDGIHLRGRDFVTGEFLSIASYWLDTTLRDVPAGTYTDSTGTIIT
jgi:predicted phosphodiesterase